MSQFKVVVVLALVGLPVFGGIRGRDDRVAMTPRSRASHAIGRLGACSAELVGLKHILTAAHCTIPGESGNGRTFYLQYEALNWKRSARTVRLVMGRYNHAIPYLQNDLSEDWALYELDTELGRDYGWLTVSPYEVRRDRPLIAAGYNGDRFLGELPTEHVGCSLLPSLKGGIIEFDCDINPGASGGPILDEQTGDLVGIVSGGTHDSLSGNNWAVASTSFFRAWERETGGRAGNVVASSPVRSIEERDVEYMAVRERLMKAYFRYSAAYYQHGLKLVDYRLKREFAENIIDTERNILAKLPQYNLNKLNATRAELREFVQFVDRYARDLNDMAARLENYGRLSP